jgi:uncharacterized protein (TIGR00730 family)
MILFTLKHIAHELGLSSLLESDPIEITKIEKLHETWAQYSLNEKEWQQFENKIDELIDKDSNFFEYFLENFKLKNKPKKIFEIMDELAKLGKLKSLAKDIMYLYGSARTNVDNVHGKHYPIIKETEELCAYLIDELKKLGIDFAMGTGGGPGQMEHPLKIALLKGIIAIGIKIQLPFEDKYNQYAQIRLLLNRFFTRIAHFYDSSRWNIATQGGFGTFQEIFGLWTLLTLGKVKNKSIIIYNNLINPKTNTRFFDGFMNWLKKTVSEEYGFIDAKMLNYLKVTKTKEDVLEQILQTPPLETVAESTLWTRQKQYLQKYFRKNKKSNNLKNDFINQLKDYEKKDGPKNKGLIYSMVRHLSQNKSMGFIFHALAEFMYGKNMLKNEPAAVSIIAPRGNLTPKSREVLEKLKKQINRIAAPLAFNNYSEFTQELMAEIENHEGNQLRILSTTAPDLLAEPAPIRRVLNGIFKRHDIKKTVLIDSSKAIVIAPGGVENIDMLFELLCLIQTNKIKGQNIPKIILLDKNFWGPLMDYFREMLLEEKMISEGDLDLFKLVDDLSEVVSDF